MVDDIVNNIFSVSLETFNEKALEVFRYQYKHNLIYKKWVDLLRVDVSLVSSVVEIPFLPIQFFKTEVVTSGAFDPQAVFSSSGTTMQITSRHYVKDLSLYTKSFTAGFERFYGKASDYCIIGLLPSYLERSGSSLVLMVDELIKQSNHPLSNFYLYDFERLANVLQLLEQRGEKVILIGVTFALIDFAEQFPMRLKETIIMETGGMKGRKKEMIRDEVHAYLKKQLGVTSIHSEYGMTELLSQAYSAGEGKFTAPPWMKVLVRDDEDPLKIIEQGRGVINVIDLANIYSCSFLATDDVGITHSNNTFEVIGRLDNSDIRGCSLMLV